MKTKHCIKGEFLSFLFLYPVPGLLGLLHWDLRTQLDISRRIVCQGTSEEEAIGAKKNIHFQSKASCCSKLIQEKTLL